ncbi:MAG: LysR family transcriptional regulator [Nitratireductor sp.]|nr:LysR family transcriptional regulator [Nitratireductor sp.]
MNLRGFDLNLLLVLDALLRDNSTTLAARRIGLSQPAVSAALGRLRSRLGDPLFVRHGQRLEPTDHARSLETPLREILENLEDLLAGPEVFDPAVASDTFKLSGSDFFSEMLMPELVERLAVEAPGMRVQLVDLGPDDYLSSLQTYKVDIAMIPQLGHPEWVDWQPVFNSSFAAIAGRGHERLLRARLRPGDIIPIDLFCELGHILFSPQGNLSAMGDAALAKIGRKRRVVMTMPSFYGVCRAVSESRHIALIPRQLAERLAPKLGLDIYKPPILIRLPTMCLFWHKRSTSTPAHRWLRGQIAAIMNPLNEGEPPLPAFDTGSQ